ncbi:putative aarF domain-containing protein kinase, chloroplastic [Porphyridium purpureum]|uniref:Putative aarF domain-containing protein kinase, chloroplastic n=1 Tax=Porphyridium purpureum TaxID=35688 RepID=A0A5J4Z3I8_PORPP|nr:putative aarF domain-containing protein kinase, chloroplastic [Porphyridium purpureum]|eukprot:POR6099..scf295_1
MAFGYCWATRIQVSVAAHQRSVASLQRGARAPFANCARRSAPVRCARSSRHALRTSVIMAQATSSENSASKRGISASSVVEAAVMAQLSAIDVEKDISYDTATDVHESGPGRLDDPATNPLYSVYANGVREQRRQESLKQPNKDAPPLLYDKQLMKRYWKARPAELNARWRVFLGVATPFFTKCIRDFAAGRLLKDDTNIREIAKMAREGFERLGPSYVKLGQILSVRPDIIPEAAQDELQRLQDNVKPFDTLDAFQVVEEELGRTIDEVFSEFSGEPVAAASLAQVYKARLRSNGKLVAVKVQRPEALGTVSKDLYVLQRAVQVYQGIVSRWTAQETDYVALLDSFAEGFYAELDFLNEARNQLIFRETILKRTEGRVYVPQVYLEMSSRRLLISEWVDGVKLSQVADDEVRPLVALGQQCFLEQLLEAPGYLHGDPHAGNILKVLDADALENPGPNKAQLCLLDYGLVTSIPEQDRQVIVRGIVHLANRDWDAVVQDFIDLKILPEGRVDRARVAAVIKKVLTPYVFVGGGAKAFLPNGISVKEVFNPSFQELTRELRSAAVEIPFQIPPDFVLILRSISVLEGIALRAQPDYKLILSTYPYVARRLLRDSADTDSFRMALNEILYGNTADEIDLSSGTKPKKRINPRRLVVLLNNALGKVAVASGTDDGSFVDAIPEDEASLSQLVDLVLSDQAIGVRDALIEELTVGIDLVLRQLTRRSSEWISSTLLTPPRLPGPLSFMPPPPVPVPRKLIDEALARLAPPLSPEEQIYVNDLVLLSFDLLQIPGDPEAALNSPLESLNVLRALVQKLGGTMSTSYPSRRGKDGRTTMASSEAETNNLIRELARALLPAGFAGNLLGPQEDSARAESLRMLTSKITSNLVDLQRTRFLGESTAVQ